MNVRELIDILSHYPSGMEIIAACDNMLFELTDEADVLDSSWSGTLCLVMNDMDEEIIYEEDEDDETEPLSIDDINMDMDSYYDKDML